MPDQFSLNLRITSVVMFPVGYYFFELQGNSFCFLTPPGSFHRHVSICVDTKNSAIDLVDGTFWPLKMRPRHLVTEKTVILHYLREKEKWIWRPQFKSSCHDFLS